MSLSGPGTVVELNPSSLNFGRHTVGTLSFLSTTLTNFGSTALSITGIAITGVGFSQTNTCGSSVGAGKSCTITVSFRPVKIGIYKGDVSISDNGGGNPQIVALSGAGCGANYRKCFF